MSRTLLMICLAAVFAICCAACEKKKTAAELQAAEQKAFRDAQKIKAQEAYQTIVTKFPDSEFAPKAQERLNVLGPPPPPATPAPKKK